MKSKDKIFLDNLSSFQEKKLTRDQEIDCENIIQYCKQMMLEILKSSKESNEQQIALLKLREFCFWALEAIKNA